MQHYFKHKMTKHTVILFAFFISAIQLVSAHSKYKAVQTLTGYFAGDPQLGDGFGGMVKLHKNSDKNDYLFVGAPGAEPIGISSGAIYIYKKLDGQYVNSQVLFTFDVLGHVGVDDIEVQDNWLMFPSIGDPTDMFGNPEFKGSVQIYTFNPSDGQYEFFQSLDSTTPGLTDLAGFLPGQIPILEVSQAIPQQGANFGFHFSLDAKHNHLMVGAENQPNPDSPSTLNPGAVYAFEVGNDGLWNLTQTITSPDGPSDQNAFGACVRIKGKYAMISSGRTLIMPKIGPILDGGNSAVYVYEFNDNTNQWDYIQKITGDQTTTPIIPTTTIPIGDAFGASLSLHGKWAFVAAPLESINPALATLTGAVYIYKRKKVNGVPQYVRKQKIYSDDLETIDFGDVSIRIHNDMAVISDNGRSGPGNIPYQGGILVLRRENGTWNKETTLFDPNGFTNSNFGVSADIQHDIIVGGANKNTTIVVMAGAYPLPLGFIGAPFHIPFALTLPVNGKVVIFEKCS